MEDAVASLFRNGQGVLLEANGQQILASAVQSLTSPGDSRDALEAAMAVALNSSVTQLQNGSSPSHVSVVPDLIQQLAAVSALATSSTMLASCHRSLAAILKHWEYADPLTGEASAAALSTVFGGSICWQGTQISHELAYATCSCAHQLACNPHGRVVVATAQALDTVARCLSAWPVDAAVGTEACSCLLQLAEHDGVRCFQLISEQLLVAIAQLVGSPVSEVVCAACAVLCAVLESCSAAFTGLSAVRSSADGLARVLIDAPWCKRHHQAAMELLHAMTLHDVTREFVRESGLLQLCVRSMETSGAHTPPPRPLLATLLQEALANLKETELAAWVAWRATGSPSSVDGETGIHFREVQTKLQQKVGIRPAPRNLFPVPPKHTTNVADECESSGDESDNAHLSGGFDPEIIGSRITEATPLHIRWSPPEKEAFGPESTVHERAMASKRAKERVAQRGGRGAVVAPSSSHVVIYDRWSDNPEYSHGHSESAASHRRANGVQYRKPKPKCGTGWLNFNSSFESGNLERAVGVDQYCYDLYLTNDLHTRGHCQWFYFRVFGGRPGVEYTFNIMNLEKPGSLYNNGLLPVLYSEELAKNEGIGWFRTGNNVCYVRGVLIALPSTHMNTSVQVLMAKMAKTMCYRLHSAFLGVLTMYATLLIRCPTQSLICIETWMRWLRIRSETNWCGDPCFAGPSVVGMCPCSQFPTLRPRSVMHSAAMIGSSAVLRCPLNARDEW